MKNFGVHPSPECGKATDSTMRKNSGRLKFSCGFSFVFAFKLIPSIVRVQMDHSIQPSPCLECGGTGRKVISPTHWVQFSACGGKSVIRNPPAETFARPHWLAFVIGIWLIAAYLWRVFIPAREFPPRSVQVLTGHLRYEVVPSATRP
jgi:hypothetical protein